MTTVAIVGLGYVGLPLAIAFGRKFDTTGYDLSGEKIVNYLSRRDPTEEVSDAEFRAARRLRFSGDPRELAKADFIIVAVPTPVDGARQPDFSALRNAAATVGRHLKRGAVVIFESTVY
ncbi:MAG: nucleotide sugar dehydrogenase, partial [Betaproteobacteria bacterium]|nr:nucleotide sugar dehydrogenase [Betaproteobacteria bacterium]